MSSTSVASLISSRVNGTATPLRAEGPGEPQAVLRFDREPDHGIDAHTLRGRRAQQYDPLACPHPHHWHPSHGATAPRPRRKHAGAVGPCVEAAKPASGDCVTWLYSVGTRLEGRCFDAGCRRLGAEEGIPMRDASLDELRDVLASMGNELRELPVEPPGCDREQRSVRIHEPTRKTYRTPFRVCPAGSALLIDGLQLQPPVRDFSPIDVCVRQDATQPEESDKHGPCPPPAADEELFMVPAILSPKAGSALVKQQLSNGAGSWPQADCRMARKQRVRLRAYVCLRNRPLRHGIDSGAGGCRATHART